MPRTARSIVVIALLVVALSATAPAQTPSSPPGTPPAVTQMDRNKLRRYIYTMEGLLASAVKWGAKDLNLKIRSAMPEVMALSGEPQARGVYLEGYGIYFDVAVPVLNQVMIASWGRMLGPDDAVVTAFTQLKSYVQSSVQNEKNPTTRASVQAMLDRLEVQLGPWSSSVAGQDAFAPMTRPTPGTSSAAIVTPNTAPPAAPPPVAGPAFDRKMFQDLNALNRAYTESVQNALIETIIDQIIPTAIRPEEFLTIAARDNMQRDSFAPLDPYEEVVTILIRVKGSDIAAYRAGQIDAVELRKRIEVREF